jgi:hypothetical protein
LAKKLPRGRGPAGHRTPHTTVEKRYRDSINKEIEAIRETIPSAVLSGSTAPYSVDSVSSPSKNPCLAKATKAELIDGAYSHLNILRARHEQYSCENHLLEQRIEILISKLGRHGIAVAVVDGGLEGDGTPDPDLEDFIFADE